MITLYSKDSKDKVREWSVQILSERTQEGWIEIKISHGVQGSDKIQYKSRYVKSGKNIGKSNETSIEQQAELELGYLVTKQKDKGYVEDVNDFQEPLKPMLAHKYMDRKHNIDWTKKDEYYSSPKLDGIRCFIMVAENGAISFISRTGKAFKHFLHIEEDVKKSHIYKNLVLSSNDSSTIRYVLDGELYNSIDFTEISSRVNSDDYDEERDKVIKFFMYDFIDMNSKEDSFITRLDKFWGEVETPFEYIELLEQYPTKDEEHMKELFSSFIEEGYEGLMLKTDSTPYVFGKRSVSLLKYKEMETEEFKILDILLAENDSSKVQIVLQSKNENKDSFTVGTVKGNKEEAYNKYYINKEEYIGKWGTVQYQTLSVYGIPLFPVFIDVREGEEIDGEFSPNV